MPRPSVPEQLVQAYLDDPTVHAVFQHAAQRGADEVETLITLAVELVKEKKRIVDAYHEHMLRCSLPLPTV